MSLMLHPDTLAATLAALQEREESSYWQVVHIVPVGLVVEGHARGRRLRLEMDLFLKSLDEASPLRLRGQLVSATWAPLTELPPIQVAIDEQSPELPALATTPLHFTLTELSGPVRVGGAQSWLQYLHPIKAMATPADESLAAAPIADALHQSLVK